MNHSRKYHIQYENLATIRPEEELYAHFIQCIKRESSERIIERFRYLFIKGTGYEDLNIKLALDKIVNSKTAEQEFLFILNRCCHIIINQWQMQPNLKPDIPKLIAEFEHILPPGSANSRSARKLRQLMKNFARSEQCLKLQRLARLIEREKGYKTNQSEYVGNLIQRYPYLHQHCLVSDDSSYEFKRTIKKMQTKIQHKYEVNLSRYVTSRVRMIQTVRQYKALNQTRIPKKIIQQVKNPTLLSDRDLDRAIHHYLGKVELGCTYHDLSQNFLTHTSQTQSYKSFKDDLYEYLITSIDSNYGKHKFNHKLYQCLQNTLPDFQNQKVNEFLLIRTCSQLFKFLVVNSKKNPEHYVLLDLISHLGETKVIGFLLKIVLLCHKIKPYLEKRFSILFSHYESFDKTGVPWLIKSLENMQVAFSIHFGNVDLSLAKFI